MTSKNYKLKILWMSVCLYFLLVYNKVLFGFTD